MAVVILETLQSESSYIVSTKLPLVNDRTVLNQVDSCQVDSCHGNGQTQLNSGEYNPLLSKDSVLLDFEDLRLPGRLLILVLCFQEIWENGPIPFLIFQPSS